MNIERMIELILSLNNGGICGAEAVDIAYQQYQEIEKFKQAELPTTDELNIIIKFVTAMNKSTATVSSSHVFWAIEQFKKLEELRKENLMILC